MTLVFNLFFGFDQFPVKSVDGGVESLTHIGSFVIKVKVFARQVDTNIYFVNGLFVAV